MYRLLLLAILGGAITVGVVACESDANGASGTTFVQIERLARPGINEILVQTQDSYTFFNTVAPSEDLTSSAGANARTEAVATLSALPGNTTANRVTNLVTAFLPDVMTIDVGGTTATAPVAAGAGLGSYVAAYSNGARTIDTAGTGVGTALQPIGGRKIEDDVIDISLFVLTDGNVLTDNVAYDGNTGNSANPPHFRLNGQAGPGETASFPFLAAPR